MNSRNRTKMVEHKLIQFATARTLWTLVTLLIKLHVFRILLKWKYIQDQNYTILAAIWWKRSYFVENVSSRSPGWSVHMDFHPGYWDLGGRNGDLRNRASPPLSYEHINIFTKKRVARRDLGKRASPVDRAHMKRPSDSQPCVRKKFFASFIPPELFHKYVLLSVGK